MLAIAKDYVSYDERHPEQKVKIVAAPAVKKSKLSSRDVAKMLGLSPATFYASTKRNRAIRLLGKGDLFKGYHLYENILKKIQHSFEEMCAALSDTPRGYKTFDAFRGAMKDTTLVLRKDVNKHGVKMYKKLIRVHKILKDFRTYETLKRKPLYYLPIDKREPLTKNFITKYYWEQKLTTEQIAESLIVPEHWVQKEIKRLDMKKKANGVKLRGRKGWVPPPGYAEARMNQPHARAVVQICPVSFKVLRRYSSTGAVERDGWNRENVRKAIKSAGLHDGFLWAYEGKEADIIKAAKAKGNIAEKLRLRELGVISKERLQELYIDQNMTTHQVANILGCHPSTVGCKAMKFGLKKRTEKISIEELKHLYLDKGMQAKEIAEMHGYSAKSISTYLSKNNITRKGSKKI